MAGDFFGNAASGHNLEVVVSSERFERRSERAGRGGSGEIDRKDHGDAERDGEDGQSHANGLAAEWTEQQAPEKFCARNHRRWTPAIFPSRSSTTTSAIAAASALCVAINVAVFCSRVSLLSR